MKTKYISQFGYDRIILFHCQPIYKVLSVILVMIEKYYFIVKQIYEGLTIILGRIVKYYQLIWDNYVYSILLFFFNGNDKHLFTNISKYNS